MTTEIIIAIISGIVAISVAFISKTEVFARKHYGIKKDLELFGLLPKNSAQKVALLNHIDKSVNKYIKESTQHRRDGTEIAIGLIFTPIGAYLSWFFYSLGAWWQLGYVISGFVLLIGLYGMVSGLRSAERDEKGRIIPKKKHPSTASK